MKTYVISLFKDVLENFQIRNNSLLDVEPFLASRPEFICDYNKGIFGKLNSRDISLGEFGCLNSHVAVLKKFLRTGDEWVCVLEDDALLCNDFNDFLVEISKRKFEQGSVYLLGHSKTSKASLKVQRLIQPLIDLHFIGGYQFGRNATINRCGTVAYCMNRAAATKYVQWTLKENYFLADDWSHFSLFGQCNIYHPLIPLVYEDLADFSSTGNIVLDKYKVSKYNFFGLIGAICKNQIKRALRLIN